MPCKKRKIKVTQRTAFWPCGSCRLNCNSVRLYCQGCEQYFHPVCEQLASENTSLFARTPYTCNSCFTNDLGEVYNYANGLLRLKQWTSIHDTDGLKYAAGREKKDLTEFSYYGQATIPHDFVEIDRNAEDIMIKCDLSSVGVPSLTTGNGNCLFNAVSIALTGNESLAMELRLRTAIEMTLNSDIYLSRSDFQQLSDHSPEYKESLLSCYKDGESSSIWTVMALSNVVGKPIQTLYPAMNGPQDQAIGALSKLFSSPDVVGTEQITILWTRMGPRPNPIWTANHFVPVFKTHYSEQIGEQTFKQQTSTPLISRKRKASVAFTDMHGNEVTVTEIKDLPGTLHASRIEADQSENEIEQSFTNTTLNCTENLLPTPENVNQTSSGRWMTADEVFRTISEKTFVHMEVPPGDKSNCYMLVDNRRNVDKFMNKRSSEFYDDCGVWDRSKGNTVKSTFINESGRLRSVEYKNNMYCLKRRVQGKVVWEALDPQPEPDQVLILCRYYAILKRNANFQKRVTYITKINNPHFGAVALYEYAGKYTLQTESHGNSKKGSGYVRSNPKTVDKIKEHVKSDQLPREIFTTLKKDDSINCPRDFKVVRNIRYNENRKENNHRPAQSNVADEILDVLSMMNEHPSVHLASCLQLLRAKFRIKLNF